MSDLRQASQEYLALRHALGHDLAEATRLLPRFVAYLDEKGARTVTIEAALAWACQPDVSSSSTVWAKRLSVTRGFARHMTGIDPATEIPPVGLLRNQGRWRPPFIYTANDIAALMTEARTSIAQPLRAATYETLIGLLAVTGMRVGEAIRLDQRDVDWAEATLLVRESKFKKSRLVPLDPSARDALRAYARRRDEVQPHPLDPSFFVSLTGKRLIYTVIGDAFRKLCTAASVGAGRAVRPRIHDLRHTFAVTTLLGWYRDGADVCGRLPWLSTYLGHRDPRYTYWYFSAAPELLALAAQRLRAVPWEVEP
jgi:integrase/recombinase XerD